MGAVHWKNDPESVLWRSRGEAPSLLFCSNTHFPAAVILRHRKHKACQKKVNAATNHTAVVVFIATLYTVTALLQQLSTASADHDLFFYPQKGNK